LEANASDPDGSLEGVQFYVNGVVQDAWSGILDFNATPPLDGQLLTIDDGTGKPTVTFEFDSNQSLSGTGSYSVTEGIFNQLNDLSVTGSYSGYLDVTYSIVVDGVGSPNTFKWSRDGGVTFVDEDISMTGSTQILENGLSVKFSALIGHELEDNWKIQAYPRNVRVPLETAGDDLARTRITRDALNHAIENQVSLGLLSFFTSDEATDDQLFLYHKMDQFLTGSASVTGSSLTVSGGTIFLNDNDFEIPNGIPDNLIRRDHSYGLPFYPFGQTWSPGAPGIYYIYSVAMDTISRNLVMSNPVFITATTGTGIVPVIEMESVSSPRTFSGSPQTISLNASAFDPDGKVIEVSFYANGTLLSRDATSPYEAELDFNASGHYEVYAVVSDDDGNDITSTVQRIVVNTVDEPQANPLIVTPPENIFYGGVASVISTFVSPSGVYDPNLSAQIFVNGQFVGYATRLPYTPPAPGQKDAGYSFLYDLPARSVGSTEVKFVVMNGSETRTASAAVSVSVNPLMDDDAFVVSVYQGMFGRGPASFEQAYWSQKLGDGSLTKSQMVDELRCREEFRKASDIMISHKSSVGTWATIADIMGTVTNANNTSDDFPDAEVNATKIGFNQTIQGRIDRESDVDTFRIDSLTPGGNDGILTLTVGSGHPTGLTTNLHLGVRSAAGSTRKYPSSGWYEPSTPNGGIQISWDLSKYTNVDHYVFSIYGRSFVPGQSTDEFLGPYTMTLSNPIAKAQAGSISLSLMDELAASIDSPIDSFSIFSAAFGSTGYIPSILSGSWYTNQYGTIGTHNPEEFFRRIFENKYDQAPSPIQISRGVEILKARGNGQQLQFLEDFSLENNVMTVGGYNYSVSDGDSPRPSLSIPNVPLDADAFAETALVYSALIGRAPTNAEVAKLTLTPQYEVRCLSKRVKLIMEMPEYGARYGLAMPIVDFVNVENGRVFSTANGNSILIEADNFVSGEILLNGLRAGVPVYNFATGYYEYSLPTTLPSGEYKLEIVCENEMGLKSRAVREIVVQSATDPVLSLTSPAIGSVLEKGESVSFGFEANESVTAYLEIDGKIHWKGHTAFDGSNLPADESIVSISDGTGRGLITFEFDNNQSVSEGNTTIEQPEILSVFGTANLSSSGTYLGTERREYLIEIDSDGSPDTFRWSLDGGANFNNSQIPLEENIPIPLSSGLSISFSSSTAGKIGDRWRVRAYPKNEIVEVSRMGTFEERIERTRQNLIRAINRAQLNGRVAIRAEDPVAGGDYDSSLPTQSLNEKTIVLCHNGSYPIKNPVQVICQPSTTLVFSDCLPLSTATGNSGELTVHMGDCFHLCKSILKIRICGFDTNGNAGYTEPVYFELRDPDRLSAELLNPHGRMAVIRIAELVNGSITSLEIVDGGSGYFDETVSFSVYSAQGKNAQFNANLDSNGRISSVTILNGGSNYELHDVVEVISPFQYVLGQPVNLQAKVNDPRGELSRVVFYVNGVEIPGPVAQSGDIYTVSYTPFNLNPLYFTVRALYGDDRDNPPDCPPTSCSCSGIKKCGFVGQGHWGWCPSWIRQHFHTNEFVCPPWFWGNSNYWPYPAPWQTRGLPPGGLLANHKNTEFAIEILNDDQLELQSMNLSDSSFVTLIVDANITQQNFSNLRLYVNGQLQADDFTNLNQSALAQGFKTRYHFYWRPEQSGIYELQIFGVDQGGLLSGNSKMVTVRVVDPLPWFGDPPTTIINNPAQEDSISSTSTVYLSASANDTDFNLKEVQFYVNGKKFGDPIPTPVDGFWPTYPYLKRWTPKLPGIYTIFSIASDHVGNWSMSRANTVRVFEGTPPPEKPAFKGIAQVAQVIPSLNGDGTISFELIDKGFGYKTPPIIRIDHFDTNGSGANFSILSSQIDSLTGEILSIGDNLSQGSGYTSVPEVILEGGFPPIDLSGQPATAAVGFVSLATTPDDQGNERGVFGLNSIIVTNSGFGYNQPPSVVISHQTAEGAKAEAQLVPALNGIGSSVGSIVVTEEGGGRPKEFDVNGTAIDWFPGYETGLTSISLVGGLPYEPVNFEFYVSPMNSAQTVLTGVNFSVAGNNAYTFYSTSQIDPYRFDWQSPDMGDFVMIAESVDSRMNTTASLPMYREVRPPSLPLGDFTSPYRAKAKAILSMDGNASISAIEITSPGSSYNLPPKVIIEGDGTGAQAEATINPQLGTLTGVAITSGGLGYTYANIRFEGGLITPELVDEYILGQTITIGLTASTSVGEIREVRLVVDDDVRGELRSPPLTSDPAYGGYLFPSQEYGQATGQSTVSPNIQRLDFWKYDGTMPDYNIYFTPAELGIYTIQADLIDDSGYTTRTSSYRVRVSNGKPPVVELLTPRTGEQFALDYDRGQDIRLVAKAQDPDWQARFGGNTNLDRRNELDRVWFFADDQFVGVGNRILGTDHYQFVWRPTVAGTYRITAIAVDDQVGDVNLDFGNIGNVGGTGTSDPQYITITDRSGSRPPDIYLINPSNPRIFAGYNPITDASVDPNSNQVAEQESVPLNDDINSQPDDDPQILANEDTLAVEYPNLYTSGSRDMVWAWADDRDGDLKSVQFYVNGAPGAFQFINIPDQNDTIYLSDGDQNKTLTFGIDVEIGLDTEKTAENLKNYLLLLKNQGWNLNAYLLPGAATKYEKSTVLIDFANTQTAEIISSNESNVFCWLFKKLTADPGEYVVNSNSVHPTAKVLDGFGGTYFGHPFSPGLNGIFSIYAIVEDTSDNRVMSIPSHYKSTMGDFQGSATIQMLANGATVPFGNNSHTIISDVTSQYPLEYVEFYDNGRLFDTPASVVDENGTYHRGRAIEFDASPYLATWNASELGEHIIYARYTDVKGNSFLSNQLKVTVAPTVGQPPEGTLTLFYLENNASQTSRVSVGSTLLARAEFVDPDSASQNVESADFYLNGNLVSSQTSPPFFLKFSPNIIQNTTLQQGSWELSVVGKDEDGNQVELRKVGLMNGAVSLPTANMVLSSSGGKMGDVFDGGNVRVSVVSEGDAESLGFLGEMAFFANGIFIGVDPGITLTDSQGNVMRKTYDFTFEVNYLLFAKNDESITVNGLAYIDQSGMSVVSGMIAGYSPVIATNEIKLQIKTPKPWSSPSTTIGEINKELFDGSFTSSEMNKVASERTGESYYAWIAEVLDRSAFQQRVDLMAAHKVALGEWFQSYQEFDDDINFYLKSNNGLPPATSSALLKTYIDDQLQDFGYKSKFGQLPYLVGSWFSREIYNYPLNRRNFVGQCLYNKYEKVPNISQNLQGSNSLLHFWSVSEPNYWEINGIKPAPITATPIELGPPPRRDAGFSFLNNFVSDRYFSGELAVELIWRLATEVKTNNLPYILYTEDIRNSIFTSATLMSLLWKENWDFAESDIQKLSPLSDNQKIQHVLSDPRFFARFNFLWRFAEVKNAEYPFWKTEDWFGTFNDAQFPWIYHPAIGWLFCDGTSSNTIWFYSPDFGWIWTSKQITKILPSELNATYLYFYSDLNKDWLIFKRTSREYFSTKLNSWVPF